MATERFKNGLMNVFTVCPATPMLAAPNPKLSSGSVPDVKTFVKNGVLRTNATKWLSSGSAADVTENRPKNPWVDVMKSGSTADVVTVGLTGCAARVGGSNSRRAAASAVKAAACTGADGVFGALVAVAFFTTDDLASPLLRSLPDFFGVAVVSSACFVECRRGLGASLV